MSETTPQGGFFPLVYDELRHLAAARLAGEADNHSLNATALVHEAYLRLGDVAFADRSGFFLAAAVAMQRILVDHARHKRAAKRGGVGRTLHFEHDFAVRSPDPDLLLDIDQALGRLSIEDPSSADVARYRLFAGLTIDEVAEAMGISRATAFREWSYARSWLATALESPSH